MYIYRDELLSFMVEGDGDFCGSYQMLFGMFFRWSPAPVQRFTYLVKESLQSFLAKSTMKQILNRPLTINFILLIYSFILTIIRNTSFYMIIFFFFLFNQSLKWHDVKLYLLSCPSHAVNSPWEKILKKFLKTHRNFYCFITKFILLLLCIDFNYYSAPV